LKTIQVETDQEGQDFKEEGRLNRATARSALALNPIIEDSDWGHLHTEW